MDILKESHAMSVPGRSHADITQSTDVRPKVYDHPVFRSHSLDPEHAFGLAETINCRVQKVLRCIVHITKSACWHHAGNHHIQSTVQIQFVEH